jgi:ankyrin repeat protein/uncharacterized glyoxalase superfamily protein PhnB
MPNALPERPSLEFLKKLAKDRLHALRRHNPRATLAAALLSVAQDHGFSSWRALKAEIDRRQSNLVSRAFEARARGDAQTLDELIDADPALASAANPAAPHGGWTLLHSAAQAGQAEIARLLLERGADPNAREAGDNTTPLHWAAAHGHLEIVRRLLDAGADVHGLGDVHELDVIGWATFYHQPGDAPAELPRPRRDVVAHLIERGARHHIFSAMSTGDLSVVQTLVEQNPEALDRRLSRFEHGLTPLHLAIERKRYDILELLIALGADLEAEDHRGHTAIVFAMLRGDREAMRQLHTAGAKTPATAPASTLREDMMALAESVRKGVPMILVPDVARALDWYASIGFKELARFGDAGVVNFGMVSFGGAELMLNMHGKSGAHDVSLWFYTDRVDELYRVLKRRQLEAASAALTDPATADRGIDFQQDIEDMFYGARQFCVRDPNGYELYFIQSKD